MVYHYVTKPKQEAIEDKHHPIAAVAKAESDAQMFVETTSSDCNAIKAMEVFEGKNICSRKFAKKNTLSFVEQRRLCQDRPRLVQATSTPAASSPTWVGLRASSFEDDGLLIRPRKGIATSDWCRSGDNHPARRGPKRC
eukprot:1403594-Amphidinium_carterae.1